MLEHIFQDKDKWKKDTFYLIKNELLSVKGNRFVQYDKKNESHLVCVYGKSQVGKTTLILNMIGLKDEACIKNVSMVLRGGVTRGNSSTSTAIIYSQSDNNLYGIRKESLDNKNNSSEIEYYSSEEMVKKLQAIRNAVEKNSIESNAILHIFIPNNYFSVSVGKENVSILDLPGVESRNIHEKAHVESLMNRYIPISSVCIIACPANVIQSLETEELPNNVDWKNLAHRFIVVLTKSYSNGSIKSYFSESRTERKVGFREFVENRYKSELELILGPNNFEFFPLDIGDSLERLLSKELTSEEDRNEVINTRDLFISSLHECILRHKGEQLLSAIKDLHAIVEHSDKEKLYLLSKKKQTKKEQLSDCKKMLERSKGYLSEICIKIKDFESSIKAHEQLSEKINKEISLQYVSFSNQLISEIKTSIEKQNLKKNKDGAMYFYDKEKYIKKLLSDYLLKNLKFELILKENQFSIDFYDSNLATSIYRQFTKKYENLLYPPPSGFLDRLFGNGCKVLLSTAYIYISLLEKIVKDEVEAKLIEECKKKTNKRIAEVKSNLAIWLEQEKKTNKKIQSLVKETIELETQIEAIGEQEKAVQSLKEQDIHTLNTFLKYAEIAYYRQREDIVKKINSNITPEEKTMYVFLLGVLFKDFQTIINASNG